MISISLLIPLSKEGVFPLSKRTHLGMVTAGLLAALFVGALDVTVVATAMPHITAELQGISLMSWIFSIYTLTTCVATPIFGKLADLFGRKAVFVVGMLIFIIGSVLCGMAMSMEALVWFRAVQGIGAGALTTVCFTIVGDIYPGEQRARMMGVFGSVWSVAGLLGPLVGGYFVDQVSWRWIFYINMPIGAIALLLVGVYLHESFERKPSKIDYWGAATFTISLSALLYALLSGGETYSWGSPVMIGLFVTSAVFLLLFLWIESRATEPMIPLSIFKIRVLNAINISGFLAFSISLGITVYAPVWIQSVLGYSATFSGFAVMPMSLAWPLSSVIVGRIMYRIGIKASVVFGSLVVLAASIWLVALTIQSSLLSWIGIVVVLGVGMGFLSTPQTVIVQSVVGWEMRGVANASNTLVRSLGQTVGIAVFGTIFNQYAREPSAAVSPADLVAGMHAVFVVMVMIAVANLLSMLLLPSHRKVMEVQKSN